MPREGPDFCDSIKAQLHAKDWRVISEQVRSLAIQQCIHTWYTGMQGEDVGFIAEGELMLQACLHLHSQQ